MAGKRHRRTNSSTKRASIGEREIAHKLDKARRARDARQARERIPAEYIRPIKDDATRRELKRHGFRTARGGVVIDGQRDRKRNPIKGAKFQAHKGGVVSFTTKDRKDYVYGFTREEKKKFAKNPESLEREILSRLRRTFPSLRGRKVQVRLQWGAYQGTKDFSPTYFTAKYFTNFLDTREKSRGKKIDALTGFHFVVHKSNAKGRKKK